MERYTETWKCNSVETRNLVSLAKDENLKFKVTKVNGDKKWYVTLPHWRMEHCRKYGW